MLEPLDPSKLVRFILEKAERTQKCSFRFAQRIIPFHAVGRADMEELKEASLKVLPDGFKTDDNRGLKVSWQGSLETDASSAFRRTRATRTLLTVSRLSRPSQTRLPS